MVQAHRYEGETKSPVDVTVRCSCGWRHRETRRQNARARAAKLKAALAAHLKQSAEKS